MLTEKAGIMDLGDDGMETTDVMEGQFSVVTRPEWTEAEERAVVRK